MNKLPVAGSLNQCRYLETAFVHSAKYLDNQGEKVVVDSGKSQRLDYAGEVRPLLREPDFHTLDRQTLNI